MNIGDAKLLYLLSCVVLGLIILSPTLLSVIAFPKGEKFSELWLFETNHLIQSGAFNVTANKPYMVYVGVGNNLGDLEYYIVYVKFRSSSDALSDTVAGQPSSLKPLYEYRLFLRNNDTWEEEFEFSLEDVSFEENIGRVSRLSLNGHDVVVDKTVVWDEAKGGLFCQFLFELWIYNTTTSGFQFHNRSVWFWFNITKTF